MPVTKERVTAVQQNLSVALSTLATGMRELFTTDLDVYLNEGDAKAKAYAASTAYNAAFVSHISDLIHADENQNCIVICATTYFTLGIACGVCYGNLQGVVDEKVNAWKTLARTAAATNFGMMAAPIGAAKTAVSAANTAGAAFASALTQLAEHIKGNAAVEKTPGALAYWRDTLLLNFQATAHVLRTVMDGVEPHMMDEMSAVEFYTLPPVGGTENGDNRNSRVPPVAHITAEGACLVAQAQGACNNVQGGLYCHNPGYRPTNPPWFNAMCTNGGYEVPLGPMGALEFDGNFCRFYDFNIGAGPCNTAANNRGSCRIICGLNPFVCRLTTDHWGTVSAEFNDCNHIPLH